MQVLQIKLSSQKVKSIKKEVVSDLKTFTYKGLISPRKKKIVFWRVFPEVVGSQHLNTKYFFHKVKKTKTKIMAIKKLFLT